MIKSLKPNEIFVFGSNLAGRHGLGAAKLARQKFGAIYGEGIGLFGQSYAIPTKSYMLKVLSVKEISHYVDKFIEFAKVNPQLTFLVTEIGTGYAGYTHTEIAPLFKDAKNVNNIQLPQNFKL